MEACGFDSANIAKIEEKIKIALAGADIEMVISNHYKLQINTFFRLNRI